MEPSVFGDVGGCAPENEGCIYDMYIYNLYKARSTRYSINNMRYAQNCAFDTDVEHASHTAY